MVDTAFGAAPGAAEPGDGWRAGLARWAAGLRAAYQRHPWVLRVPLSGELLLCPNNIAWMEDALQCLAGTSLPEPQQPTASLQTWWIAGWLHCACIRVSARHCRVSSIHSVLIDITSWSGRSCATD